MAATKEQERKALEQIKKIVEGLGDNSYIGMAFEGCFEIAEENITNDFGCSMKQRADKAAEEAEYFKGAAENFAAEQEKAQKRVEELEKTVEQLTARRDELLKDAERKENDAVKNWNKFREQEDRADRAEEEIIKLKAKLYDLLIKE